MQSLHGADDVMLYSAHVRPPLVAARHAYDCCILSYYDSSWQLATVWQQLVQLYYLQAALLMHMRIPCMALALTQVAVLHRSYTIKLSMQLSQPVNRTYATDVLHAM
jgi:hypothetical protein